MNAEQFEGQWNEVKGKVKATWGKFTQNDITEINGNRDNLVGKLQQLYGYTEEEAQREADTFMQSCETESCNTTSSDCSTQSDNMKSQHERMKNEGSPDNIRTAQETSARVSENR